MKRLEPATGRLLLSEPFLMDPNFKRTVVLLCEHHETEGTVGFVLNKQLKICLKDVMPDFSGFDAPLFWGGPVQPETLHYVHTLGDMLEGSREVIEGVYWGGNFEALKALVNSGQVAPTDFRFFVGYSGWAPGQLMDEMRRKSWIIAEGNANHVFKNNPVTLWQQILTKMGKGYRIMANFPETPSLN